ncbi:MAG TPA: Fic family protein [Candidatus Acidoferrales bacterium]|nr:Fic family protein [Candidatus Acidoferrales bacterium]
MVDPKNFTSKAPGDLVAIADGHFAFVPHPLPPDLEYEARIIRPLEDAALALGQLKGIGQTLPNPHMLIRAFQRREALLSSRIEGTVADQQELLFAEMDKTKAPAENVREVRNYVDALNFGLKQLDKLPVCLRLIRDVHQRLMRGVRGQEQRPGEFRDVQNYVGKPGGFGNARYIPPPVAQMTESLGHFERFLHEETEIPPLIRLALIHYQFEAIHPFRDGNGRIGRLLLALLLCDWKLLSSPLLYLSAYFDHHRDEYFDHLLAVSQRGTWNDWIVFFLQGVAEQARDAVDRAQKLLALRDEYRTKMQSAHAPGSCLLLIDSLFEVPAITVPLAADKLKLSYPGAKRNVLKLVEAGVLTVASPKLRPKLYLAPGIMELVSAF